MLLLRDPEQGQTEAAKTPDSAHAAPKASRFWTQASRGCRLLMAAKSDAGRKRASSPLGCPLPQHPDAWGEERNPSNPFQRPSVWQKSSSKTAECHLGRHAGRTTCLTAGLSKILCQNSCNGPREEQRARRHGSNGSTPPHLHWGPEVDVQLNPKNGPFHTSNSEV